MPAARQAALTFALVYKTAYEARRKHQTSIEITVIPLRQGCVCVDPEGFLAQFAAGEGVAEGPGMIFFKLRCGGMMVGSSCDAMVK